MPVDDMTRTESIVDNIRAFDNNTEDNFFSQASSFEVKITQDTAELNKAKILRLKNHSNYKTDTSTERKSVQSNTLQAKQLIEQQQILIHDGYDSYADHLIIIDHEHNKVIAYVRLIDAFTAYKIGGYYCETQFNLSRLFKNQTFYLEMSRLVIDPEYDNREIAALLWSGITKHAQEKGIDSLIGSLPLYLARESNGSESDSSKNPDKSANCYAYLNHLKKHAMSNNQQRVQPYQLLPDMGSSPSEADFYEHPLIEYFFEQGAKLCGDAYWNKEYNSAELFIHYPLPTSSLFPECIRINEVQLGMMCE